MSKYCVIPEEVRFDIEMELYEKYNYSISKMYEYLGDYPRIELFARQTADGWDCWGDEV